MIADNIAGTVGRVTAAVGTGLGGLTSLLMIIVLGIFIAIEPRLYELGVAWMLPMKSRENFYITTARMGFTLRRLMAGRLLGKTGRASWRERVWQYVEISGGGGAFTKKKKAGNECKKIPQQRKQ